MVKQGGDSFAVILWAMHSCCRVLKDTIVCKDALRQVSCDIVLAGLEVVGYDVLQLLYWQICLLCCGCCHDKLGLKQHGRCSCLCEQSCPTRDLSAPHKSFYRG